MERYFDFSYAGAFFWGIAVLFGFIGWGRLVAQLVSKETAPKAGWGLQAVWGMAVYLFVGGTLAVFGACGELAITLLIGIGLSIMAWTTVRGGWPGKASLAALPWMAWPAFAVVALQYAGGVCWQGNVNACDDFAAYFNYCEKLLASGSFDDPLSWRRLASLGGHTLLQCSTLSKSSYGNIQLFELGLCPVILLGLLLGFRGGALRRSPLGVFIALLAVTTPILRVNTSSHSTGLVLLLGLFATLDLMERTDSRRRLLVVAGLVGAALCSLRAQDVAAAGGTLGIFWLASWIRDRLPPKQALLEAACWGGALFVALLPWMIMGIRSNGSPLFPLFPGDNSLAFNPQGIDGSLYAKLNFPLKMIVEPMLLPLLLCLMAAPEWRQGLAARAVSIAAVLTSLLLAYGLSMAPDDMTVPRYVQPLLLAGALAILATAAVSPRRRMAAWALGVVLLLSNIHDRGRDLMYHYMALAHPSKLVMPYPKTVIADYREAQLLIPEGRRALICGDFPFLFDHARNPLWNIDLPGGASPAPGLPYKKPPEEMKRYLRKLGIEYVIFVDFAESMQLYNRAEWQKTAQGDVPLWKHQAPFYLDFFDTVDRLSTTETVLGKVGKLTVLQFKP